ncbi:hypothetical protein DRE_01490 [Drechslerella stenobrocha 248]|uniref:Zn(2)-C6 fungal-type domain-containing protein n=1 Tax=Drechslerella stenobrocha 248 TaxID=1043628 RepID=W7HUT7_9PEZI|nr:hypothetical protein DRE_01490 [Drechslerella stenobrocha 248]
MSLKRPASVADDAVDYLLDDQAGSANSSSASTIKNSTNSEDFTRTVRKRLANTTRTGQACDRCKIRKIRCDGLAGGCSPCRQNNTECRTTDRISHRAVPRGYIEQLEKKCADYEAKIKDMEALLKAGGLAIPEKSSHDGSSSASGSTLEWGTQNDSKDPWATTDHIAAVKMEQQTTLPFSMDYSSGGQQEPPASTTPVSTSPNREGDPNGRPAFLIQKCGASHVGLYSGNSYMASTRASALSVLGITIDLADMQGVPEPARSLNHIPVNSYMDFTELNPLDDSLQSFLMSTSRHAPVSVLQLSLPSKEEALMLVEWNFMVTQPYLPLLHKPTFMAEFHRMYDIPDYKTSPAHLVITHMILAMSMYFMAKRQVKVNTPTQPDLSRSYRHYHFSLTFFNLLIAGGTLEDCQALIYLLMFTRGFTRPGPAYLLSKVTTATLFELRLHRSLKKQHERTGTKLNVLEDEMRKRAFWIGIALDVGISARLNRPLGVIPSDYDIEYPARIEDEHITEDGFTQDLISPDARCSFDVAFGLFKCAEFTIDIHTQLYGAQKLSRKDYRALVETVEAKMTAWKNRLPRHLLYDPTSADINLRMQAANLMLWYNELRILLRHPSLNLSISPSFSSDNLTICVESSRTILEMTDLMRQENNLDSAWYATSVPLLACMTILFAIWEKRETVTPTEIARVKADMDLSANVMKEFGKWAGANNKLGDIIMSLTEATMKMLKEQQDNRALASSNANSTKRRASLSVTTFVPQTKQESQHQHTQHTAVPQLVQPKHYAYPQPTTDHMAAGPPPQPTSIYVEPNMSNIQQIAHSHVDLHSSNGFPDTRAHHANQIPQDPVRAAAAALAAASAAQQQPQQQPQPQQQSQQSQQHQYYIPHTAASSQYWYGASDSWKEYLNQMTSLAGDAGGFPAMALMSLGQPAAGRDMDAQWGFMNIYDFDNGDAG